MQVRAVIVSALALAAAPLAAQEPLDGHREMAEIFAADQAARSNGGAIDWEVVGREDADRRARVRELLENGGLTTGRDYYAAAFVFQHGSEPADYLLAHALAVRSLALGIEDAEWIAAATLDRYLQTVGAGQIYGTQFRYTPETGTTMEPYDRDLLTDGLREAANAHTLAEQEARMAEMDAELRAMVGQEAGTSNDAASE